MGNLGNMGVRLVACMAAAGWMVAGLAGPSSADQASIEVGNAAEAWYSVAEAADPCTLPIGCPAAPVPPAPVPTEASPYPEGTLHVESVAGEQSAHAYLLPDLEELPPQATPITGTLTLPLSEEPESGNTNVAAAKIVACLATAQIEDGVYGGTADSPDYDCEEAKSPAKFDPRTGTFTVDLDPFLEHWAEGNPAYGIALVPAKAEAPQESWHVSLNGSSSSRTPKCVSALTYREPGGPLTPDVPPTSGGPDVPATPPIGESAALNAPEAPSAPELAPAPPPEVSAQPTPAQIGLMNSPWYKYRGVVFLPLAFMVALVISGRTLTRPLVATIRR